MIQHHGNTRFRIFTSKRENAADRVCGKKISVMMHLSQTKEVGYCSFSRFGGGSARSLSKPSAGRVEAVIRKIIKDKLNTDSLMAVI